MTKSCFWHKRKNFFFICCLIIIFMDLFCKNKMLQIKVCKNHHKLTSRGLKKTRRPRTAHCGAAVLLFCRVIMPEERDPPLQQVLSGSNVWLLVATACIQKGALLAHCFYPLIFRALKRLFSLFNVSVCSLLIKGLSTSLLSRLCCYC